MKKKPIIIASALALMAIGFQFTGEDKSAIPLQANSAKATEGGRIDVARYTEDGDLILPDDLDQWIFMGASLGMGYFETDFDDSNPGMFQIVLMEPTAYDYFLENGDFAEGTMFVLSFNGSNHRLSTNRSGFVMGGFHGNQIHVLDSSRFADGHNFFDFFGGGQTAEVLPDGNGCVTCHDVNGAFKGTFAQFYPTIRDKLPEGVLERSFEKGTERPQ